jgi:hypothetical protein
MSSFLPSLQALAKVRHIHRLLPARLPIRHLSPGHRRHRRRPLHRRCVPLPRLRVSTLTCDCPRVCQASGCSTTARTTSSTPLRFRRARVQVRPPFVHACLVLRPAHASAVRHRHPSTAHATPRLDCSDEQRCQRRTSSGSSTTTSSSSHRMASSSAATSSPRPASSPSPRARSSPCQAATPMTRSVSSHSIFSAPRSVAESTVVADLFLFGWE